MKNQYSKQGLTVPPSGLRPSSFGAFSRKVRSLTANVLLAIGLLAGPAAAFTHPGIPFTTADLDATKANLNTEPWKSGYASLVAQGQSKLSYVMAGPFASVSRTPDVNLSQWKNDMQAIYNLARMGYYTGDGTYSQKARDILVAWAQTHQSFDGAEMYLSMGDYAYRAFGGASILRGSWAGWTQADTDLCKTYFNNVWWQGNGVNVANPLRSANQGALQLCSAVGVAVFCDDSQKFALCLQSLRADINSGLFNSLPNGQVADSGRDQGHAGGQVWSLAWMAEVFWKQGVDVYAELDNRLLAVGEFYSRYNHGAATPYIPFGAKYDYYPAHGGAPLSAVRAPDFLNIFHAAYVTRKGLSAPWTALYRSARTENSDSFDFRKAADASSATPPVALAPAAPAAAAITGDLANAEIGTATPTGSGTYASGTWTVTGGGTNISGTTDSYHFTHRQVTGDFTLTAQVTSLTNTNPYAGAGLVMCDSLSATATRRVYFGYNPGTPGTIPNRVESQQRGFAANSHDDPDEFTHDGVPLPQWLKLQRIGTRVLVFHSDDGANWIPLQYAEYTGWNDTAYIGLGVFSRVNGTPATATFSNVSITGGSGVEAIVTPSAPRAVYASPGNRQVPLRWLPCRGATSYQVKRSTTSGSGYATIATVADGETSYTDNALTNGTTYYYVVSAVNSVGESAGSPEESVTPLPPIIRVEAESYSAQTGIQLENCAEGGQNVAFIGNNDTTRYDAIDFGTGATTIRMRVANVSTASAAIEMRLDSLTGPLVGTIPVPVTGGNQLWTTSAITPGSITGVHDVYLKFITGGFNLNWFEYQRLDAPLPVAAPAAPAGFTATPVNLSRINLAWNAASGAASYRVKRSTTGSAPYSIIAENHSGTTFSDSGLPPGTAYHYIVSALGTGGESAGSTQVSATTFNLPAPWSSLDIGAVGLMGGADHVAGVFTVKGSGTDIQSTADLFHFASQPFTGDVAIVARVASLTSGDQWAKSGVMMRESLAADSINTCMVVSKSNGVSWQRRTATGGTTSVTTTTGIAAPHWVKLVRTGDTFAASTSADGLSWTLRGSQNITMGSTLYIGLAACARNNTQLNTSTFDNVAVVTPPAIPTGLAATSGVGQISLSWNPATSAASYDVMRSTTSGSGYTAIATGITGTSYDNTGLSTPTTYYYVVSAVNGFGTSANSAQADTTPSIPAAATASSSNVAEIPGNAFDGSSATKWYNDGPATGWLQYQYENGTSRVVTGYIITSANDVPQRDPKDWQLLGSNDGSTWTTLDTQASQTFTDRFQAKVYALPNTTGHTHYRLNITANQGGTGYGLQLSELNLQTSLPSPWSTADIGAVAAGGGAAAFNGTYAVLGSGADISVAADEFRYVYQTATGDCSIVTRVNSIQNTDTLAKAGVMIRESLNANSRNAMVAVTPSSGIRFQRRTSTGGSTFSTSASGFVAPYWVRLVRTGSTFTASRSANGTAWTTIGTQSITMGSTVYIGLPVTSRVDGTRAAAGFDNVTATP